MNKFLIILFVTLASTASMHTHVANASFILTQGSSNGGASSGPGASAPGPVIHAPNASKVGLATLQFTGAESSLYEGAELGRVAQLADSIPIRALQDVETEIDSNNQMSQGAEKEDESLGIDLSRGSSGKHLNLNIESDFSSVFQTDPLVRTPQATRLAFESFATSPVQTLHALNKSNSSLTPEQLMVKIANQPEQALFKGIELFTDATIRLAFNLGAKLISDLLTRADCLSTGLDTCVNLQDVQNSWGEFLTGEKSEYRVVDVLLDSMGALPLIKGAPAVLAELQSLPKMGSRIVSATEKSFKAFKASYKSLGFSDELGLILGKESEQALARARAQLAKLDLDLTPGLAALETLEQRVPGFLDKVFKDARPDQIYNFASAVSQDSSYVSRYLDPSFSKLTASLGLGDYEKAHMGLFTDGFSFFVAKSDWELYAHDHFIGAPAGKFVTSTGWANKVEREVGRSSIALEKALGFDHGVLEGQVVLRIDLPFNPAYKPNFPNANFIGANGKFLPGGFTSGGVPEIIVVRPPKADVIDGPRSLGVFTD